MEKFKIRDWVKVDNQKLRNMGFVVEVKASTCLIDFGLGGVIEYPNSKIKLVGK